MTRLEEGKPVTRETAAQQLSRPLVVRLHARYLEIWIKGDRERVSVHYQGVLAFARKLAWRSQAQRAQREKR